MERGEELARKRVLEGGIRMAPDQVLLTQTRQLDTDPFRSFSLDQAPIPAAPIPLHSLLLLLLLLNGDHTHISLSLISLSHTQIERAWKLFVKRSVGISPHHMAEGW